MDEKTLKDLNEAYTELDQVLRKIIVLEGVDDGLLTDWVCLAAVQGFSSQGDSQSLVARILPDRGDAIPFYRVMGLLEAGREGLSYDLGSSSGDEEEDA